VILDVISSYEEACGQSLGKIDSLVTQHDRHDVLEPLP